MSQPFVADTEEGRAIADALIVLGNCLHQISREGTGKFKYEPADPLNPGLDRRTPTEFVRHSMTKLLERYREVLKITMGNMYQQYVGTKPYDRALRQGAK